MKWHKRSQLWFWFVWRAVLPWLMLAIATLKLTWLGGIERTKEQVRLMTALTQIDFVRWFELIQDIADDLPYWFY